MTQGRPVHAESRPHGAGLQKNVSSRVWSVAHIGRPLPGEGAVYDGLLVSLLQFSIRAGWTMGNPPAERPTYRAS